MPDTAPSRWNTSRDSSGKPTSPKSIEDVIFQDFIFSRKLEGFEIYTCLCFTRMCRVALKTSVTCCWFGSLLDFIPLGTGSGSKSGSKYPKITQILEVCQGSRFARRGPWRATWRRVLRTMSMVGNCASAQRFWLENVIWASNPVLWCHNFGKSEIPRNPHFHWYYTCE